MSSCQHYKSKLIDSFNRRIQSVRLSITDRCNLRCKYCMPEDGIKWLNKENKMTSKDIVSIARLLHSFGINKFRITGGEPTLRQDLIQICKQLQAICPDIQLAMTTNGIKLKELAKALYFAGVRSINISIDSLDKSKFEQITLRNVYDKVIEGIYEVMNYPFRIKLNTVLINGFNDNEVSDFIDFSEKTGIEARLIELMPFTGNNWKFGSFLSKADVIQSIQSRENLKELKPKTESQTSRTYSLRDGKAKLGFIASVSESFCKTCDRIRITAEGNLRACLHSPLELPLKQNLNICSTAELRAKIIQFIKKKWKEHPNFQIADYRPPLDDRAMILIGG